MQYVYLLALCKIVVGFAFTISLLAKLLSFSHYVDAVHDFQLLPKASVPFAAMLFLIGEGLIVLLLFKWPVLAFWLASGLLLVFSIALAAVMIRNMQITCNCFGASQRRVSPADLVRNVGFLLCSCGGGWFARKHEAPIQLAPLEQGIVWATALAFVLIWTQVGEIYRLLQATEQPT